MCTSRVEHVLWGPGFLARGEQGGPALSPEQGEVLGLDAKVAQS